MPASGPNVVIILADDMGYSDIGCFGGEIRTPNLDVLAGDGLRMTQFYNTARCSPSRASLLTGLHPHQTGLGVLTEDQRPRGYAGTLNDRCATMAELLGSAGWSTYMSGKWHLCGEMTEPNAAWPTRRGFDRFYGTLAGAGSYFDPFTLTRDETNVEHEAQDPDFFYTDAISAEAAGFVEDHASTKPDEPFFMYVAYTAPHWPLHATEEDIAAYDGHYDEGWDVLRERRYRRMVEQGIIAADWPMSDRDPEVRAWNDTTDQEWESRRMQVYAAQIERMDAGIGRILSALEATGNREDTIVMFLSDNGGCAEELRVAWSDELARVPAFMRTYTRAGERVRRGNTPDSTPGPETTYASYGRCWANLSNTPFREYKHWVHEGGIATPLIVRWPSQLDGGRMCHSPYQLPDVLATVLEACDVEYPAEFDGRPILPAEGVSMLPAWTGGPEPEHVLFWEHEGNAAARKGPWKLVRKFPGQWELYDMRSDRTELSDVSERHPELAADLAGQWEEWAKRCGVVPREVILEIHAERAS